MDELKLVFNLNIIAIITTINIYVSLSDWFGIEFSIFHMLP